VFLCFEDVFKELKKTHADNYIDMQKISNNVMNHSQVEDADDPSLFTDMSSCCSMKPFCAAAL